MMSEPQPTTEQQAIITAARSGKNLVIQAGAGTGKTSTLKMAAHALGGRKAVYVAYNRSIAMEAAARFPSHVTCRTAHSLALQAVGREYAHRLRSPRELPSRRAEILGTTWLDLGPTLKISPIQMARIAVETVMRFCYSANDEITLAHVPRQNGVSDADHAAIAQTVLPYANRAWTDVCHRNGLLKFQHDHYLKMWALTKPQLPAEVVMLDEAQDSNPVVAQLVQQQEHAQRIAVGDSCQQLYAWRGAVDALTNWQADERLYLSRSWRFGPAVAAEANKWLAQLDTHMRLTGTPSIPSTLTELETPKAVLCRTNAEAMNQVLELLAQGSRVALVGGGADIRRLAQAADELKSGRRTSHPELYVFTTWAALQDYVEEDQAGRDLKPFVDLIDTHGAGPIIAAIDRLDAENDADTTVSTAHRSKGREWASVKIAADYPEPNGNDTISHVDAMLGYVAVTRARMQLDRTGLAWVDRFCQSLPASA